MTPVLEARNLSKRFGALPAIAGVSLAIREGEFVAVLGPSGAGKSTLFRCLTRLAEPDEGDVRIAGRSISGLRGHALAASRRDIGIVFQQFNLIRRLTALDNVLVGRLASAPLWRVALRRFSEPDEASALASLARVGLLPQARQRADTLSGGQQQRVAIARALVQKSHVLLADEPVASLDPDSAAAILGLLKDLTREAGLAVLCTLHQPELASRFADRILRMERGRLSESGRAEP